MKLESYIQTLTANIAESWTVLLLTGLMCTLNVGPSHSGPESSQSWPKIKIAECDFSYFFRSLEKQNILKYMIISIFIFSNEFKAVIYACKHEKSMTFAQK